MIGLSKKLHFIIKVKENQKWLLLASISIVFILLFFQGFIFQRDSIGYENMHPVRTPGYPILIHVFRLLSRNHYLDLVFLFQLVLGIITVYFVALAILKYFNLRFFFGYIISIILLLPYIFKLNIASHIFTEPIAYPLFLFFLTKILIFNLTLRINELVWAIFIFTVLLIFRTQFLFIYPALVLYYIILLYTRKICLRKMFVYLLLTAVSFGLVKITDRTYHLIQHKSFSETPFTGIQLLTKALYVSEEKDSVLFEDEEYRNAFNLIMSQISERKYNMGSFIETSEFTSKDNINDHYRNTYNLICWKIIEPSFHDEFELDENNFKGWAKLDRMTLNMAKVLLREHYSDFLFIQFSDIYFYGFFPHLGFIFSLLFVIILFLKLKANDNIAFLAFIFLLDFFNILLCSFVEPLLIRYLFYTKIALFIFVLAFCINIMDTNRIKISTGKE